MMDKNKSYNGQDFFASPASTGEFTSSPLPWILLSFSFFDRDNDLWQGKVLCTGFEPDPFTKKITATFVVKGTCILSDQRMTESGYDVSRFYRLLGHTRWNAIDCEMEDKQFLAMEQINDKLAKKLQEQFLSHVNDIWDLRKKKEWLNQSISSTNFSRFIDDN